MAMSSKIVSAVSDIIDINLAVSPVKKRVVCKGASWSLKDVDLMIQLD
jgi:hypothetical protein